MGKITIETVFAPGQKVWCVKDNVPQEVKIGEIKIKLYLLQDGTVAENTVYTCTGGFQVNEKCVFATKEELRKYLFGE